ncbi:unnamed protein product, partial [Prorocentrum cordatum]
GFGSVRLVEHAKTGQRYALKRVPKRRGKKVEELVVRECDLLAEMDHPFILKLVKNFDTASSIYILTELLTGGELFAALERLKRVLTREEAQFYAGSLVLVLDYLGDRRIVFRDLKPENVMLDGQGYIKLIDFGTAKKLAKDEGRTFTKIGSCQFMAPEVPLGRGYGTEVDIWSLGIMLFEFVCGYLPFGRELDNSSEVEIYRSAQEDNLTFPQFYKDSDGKHLMRGLLRKDPKSRLGTGLDGFQVIKDHDFFRLPDAGQTLFDMLIARELKPPFEPDGESYMEDDINNELELCSMCEKYVVCVCRSFLLLVFPFALLPAALYFPFPLPSSFPPLFPGMSRSLSVSRSFSFSVPGRFIQNATCKFQSCHDFAVPHLKVDECDWPSLGVCHRLCDIKRKRKRRGRSKQERES